MFLTLTEKAIQQRWKTARDAFVRFKNGRSEQKRYVFYEELKFLNKRRVSSRLREEKLPIQCKVEKSSVCEDDEEESISDSMLEDDVVLNGEMVKCEVTETLNPTITVHDPLGSSSSTTVNTPNSHSNKRMASSDDFDDELMQLVKDDVKMMKNDDLFFFMSLKPVTEQFTVHQKLLFRTEVLKKAMEIADMPKSLDTPKCSGSLDS